MRECHVINQTNTRYTLPQTRITQITQQHCISISRGIKGIHLFLALNLHASTGLCAGTWKMRWSRRDRGVATSRFVCFVLFCLFVCLFFFFFVIYSFTQFGFWNIDGFGLVFLDVITCFGMSFAVFWYLDAFWLDSKVVEFNPKQIWYVYYENHVFSFQLILFGFQIMILL